MSAAPRGHADSDFRVREWPYMFSLSVCWALDSEEPGSLLGDLV